MNTIKNQISVVNKIYLPLMHQISKIQNHIESDRQLVQKYFSEGDFKKSYAKIFLTKANQHPVFKEFKSIQIDIPLNWKDLPEDIAILKRYYSEFIDNCKKQIESDNLAGECLNSLDKLTNRVSFINKKSEKKISHQFLIIQHAESETVVYHIILSSLAIVLTIIIAILLFFSLSPIKTLINAIKKVEQGEFPEKIEISANNEIGLLSDSFNHMISTLKTRDNQIKKQNDKLTAQYQKEIEIQNRLIQSERLAAIGKLSAQIAHEIRNPLNSIVLNTEIIEDEIDITPIKPLFNSMKREIERLVEITDNYLQLSKNPKIQKKPIEISLFLEQILLFLDAEFKNRRISIIFKPLEISLFIDADENRLKQVFINLIKNSIEAISQNGVLEISIIYVENRLDIVISDNGIGIREDDLEHIFEPFFTTKNYGTGLGLFLVKQIIEEHGGGIECKSIFGEKTSFILSFLL
ncbi:HAMP domain-containing protein [bacterium]|nr:HAMP domain-containing protein [bacterium]